MVTGSCSTTDQKEQRREGEVLRQSRRWLQKIGKKNGGGGQVSDSVVMRTGDGCGGERRDGVMVWWRG
ncbi:hypothetical protein A2U01_0060686 [Trifolium medium]|uniref:Uncharacterized protein n=1 Tax=Trifolium medium TaxID=97028 RepID=A0A392RV23_9FABA|nr:hypothetical protein [Trifolium medium]